VFDCGGWWDCLVALTLAFWLCDTWYCDWGVWWTCCCCCCWFWLADWDCSREKVLEFRQNHSAANSNRNSNTFSREQSQSANQNQQQQQQHQHYILFNFHLNIKKQIYIINNIYIIKIKPTAVTATGISLKKQLVYLSTEIYQQFLFNLTKKYT
jgi:hypothetical protein